MAINQNQNNQNINPLQPDFEQIKKLLKTEKNIGVHASWRKFLGIVPGKSSTGCLTRHCR